MLDTLFSSKKIGNCQIPNRLVVPAMVTNFCTEDGMVTDRFLKYIEEKAKGGWGLIITEDYAVNENAKGYRFIPGLYNDGQIEGNKKLTQVVHQYGSKIFCQIYHPGRQSTHFVNGGVQPIAPSATMDPLLQEMPREITVEEIHQIVKDFGECARRAKESGFDGIEIHAAHGYLIAEFLSTYTNKRVDEYGGCFDNRVRFLDEIYAVVRQAVGTDFPVIVRISVNEYLLGGRTEAESFVLARHCEELGFDAVHISNGMYASPVLKQIIAPMFTEHALNMQGAQQVKELLTVPVILTNRINDPRMADTLLKMGKADFIGMGRGSLADPYLPVKAQKGQFGEIRYCIGCLQGCEQRLFEGTSVSCLVNPRIGREYESDLTPTQSPKKVMVIGGGPGGLMAAETAAKLGHKVSLYEKNGDLGGQFKSAAYPIGKGELSTVVSSLRQSLVDLQVPIHLNTEVTQELLEKEKPDAVILATGATPVTPKIPGIDGQNVVVAEDVLLGKSTVKPGPVVVCGGGEVGGEVAQFVAESHPDVTILEMQDDILNDMMIFTRKCLVQYLKDAHVKVQTRAKVETISEEGVTYSNESGEKVTVPATTVISAFGYRAYNPLAETAKGLCSNVVVIGGAVKAGNALTAMEEGYKAALSL
jgi:2,4-dienoyl-CoA reductase-like NADH-dependent reductase (Old Yellow Enzyme family)/thioredoxin reductase